jgi:beta-lysine 5,6-aminomutase beta subunit
MTTSAQKQLLRAYGDRRDDGVIQLSFTLPVPMSEKAKEAALLYCKKLGLEDVKVAATERAADGYSFFIVYARSPVVIDYNEIDTPELVIKKLGFGDLNALIEDRHPHRGHRRHPQHEGLCGGLRPGTLPVV